MLFPPFHKVRRRTIPRTTFHSEHHTAVPCRVIRESDRVYLPPSVKRPFSSTDPTWTISESDSMEDFGPPPSTNPHNSCEFVRSTRAPHHRMGCKSSKEKDGEVPGPCATLLLIALAQPTHPCTSSSISVVGATWIDSLPTKGEDSKGNEAPGRDGDTNTAPQARKRVMSESLRARAETIDNAISGASDMVCLSVCLPWFECNRECVCGCVSLCRRECGMCESV
jgi:hypothetical protein